MSNLPDVLASVTPDAGGKTRFVLVDAAGVTESDKTDSRPMESKPTDAFDKLLLGIAMGARDEATIASRLARMLNQAEALSSNASTVCPGQSRALLAS